MVEMCTNPRRFGEKGATDEYTTPAARAGRAWMAPGYLLEFDGGAGLFEIGLELLGLVALDALLDGLRSVVDHCLCLLEAEAGGRADRLDHGHLLVARAGQDDVDGGGLLLGRGIAAAAAARGGRRRCDRGRRYAELLLERLDALGELEHRDSLELLDPILCGRCCHGVQSSLALRSFAVGFNFFGRICVVGFSRRFGRF